MFQLCDRLSHKNIYASFAAVIHAARETFLAEYVCELKGIRVINVIEVHQWDDPTEHVSARTEIRSKTSSLNLRSQLFQLGGTLSVRHWVARFTANENKMSDGHRERAWAAVRARESLEA